MDTNVEKIVRIVSGEVSGACEVPVADGVDGIGRVGSATADSASRRGMFHVKHFRISRVGGARAASAGLKRGYRLSELLALFLLAAALLLAAVILMPAKAYAGTVKALPVGSSTGTVWCRSSDDGAQSYFFYLNQRSNLRITVSHEVYSTDDRFLWLGLANRSDNSGWGLYYPDALKNTSNDSYLQDASIDVPSYMSSSTITYTNLSAGGPYYINVDTDQRDWMDNGNGYDLNSYYSLSITDVLPIWEASVSVGTAKSYSGRAVTFNPRVSMYKKVLTLNHDYRVSFSNNRNPGKASMTVTGIGKYSGSKTVSFTIAPKKVGIRTPAAGDNKITVKWNRAVGASGYQIRYASSYKESHYDYYGGRYRYRYVTKWRGWRTTLAGSTASSKVLRLANKTKYRMQVRAYKTIDGRRYYGAWSAVKTATTR